MTAFRQLAATLKKKGGLQWLCASLRAQDVLLPYAYCKWVDENIIEGGKPDVTAFERWCRIFDNYISAASAGKEAKFLLSEDETWGSFFRKRTASREFCENTFLSCSAIKQKEARSHFSGERPEAASRKEGIILLKSLAKENSLLLKNPKLSNRKIVIFSDAQASPLYFSF